MKHHNNVFFRAVTALLAAAFLLSCTACGGTAATTIELLRTQGEVAVADKDGKGVSIIEGLKLYSGYQVDTRSESYAWINLDNIWKSWFIPAVSSSMWPSPLKKTNPWTSGILRW